jgi:ankyrin repeat protein
LLLKNGAKIETRDIKGQTPLSRATGNGNKILVQLLLDQGAEIEDGDKGVKRLCLGLSAASITTREWSPDRNDGYEYTRVGP